MIYLLDSNTCIQFLNGRSPGVRQRLLNTSFSDMTVCAIVKAELFHGAMKSQHPANTLAKQKAFLDQFISLPFDDRAAEVYGQIKANLERLGKPIGPNDFLIAAIALAHNLTLVTHNSNEFGRVLGLRFEDWEAATPE